jgi:hypothetical protein
MSLPPTGQEQLRQYWSLFFHPFYLQKHNLTCAESATTSVWSDLSNSILHSRRILAEHRLVAMLKNTPAGDCIRNE